MKKIFRIWVLASVLSIPVIMGAAVSPSSRQGGSYGENRAKARYYFLQGSLETASENMPQAFEYFKKAYETDPTFKDASFTYGNQRMFLRNDTLQTSGELLKSLKMMQAYVDENPKDLYATQMYGYVTTALDTLEEAVRVYESTYNLLPSQTHLLQMLSDAYIRLRRSEDALKSLERYEAIEGKSRDVSLNKITIMMALNDTVGAVSEVESLVKSNPRDPYSLILKGNLYEVIGKNDSVLTVYKEAEKLAPNNGVVKMSLANYYRAQGDSVMLDNMMYEALLSEDFELEDKLGILGDYLQKLLEAEGDRTRGDYLFATLQSQYPHEPEVLEMSARYSAAKGEYEAAADALTYAVDLDPTNEQYWLLLLSFNIADGKYQEAVKNYEKAKQHFQPTLRLKNLYAASASILEDTEKGIKILRELLKETNENLNENKDEAAMNPIRKTLDYDGLKWVSSLYCMLGDLHYKRGEKEEGFIDYENSLYFLSDNALTLNNFAYFLSEEDRDLEKAKKMSRRALELVENNATYLDTYAWILYKMGDYQEALDYMKLALDLAKEQGDDNDEYKIHLEAIEKALEKDRKTHNEE